MEKPIYSPKRPIINPVARLKYLVRLLTDERFYDAINTIFTDVFKLDSLLSTVCYFSLFVAELIRLRPKIAKSIKGLMVKLGLLAIQLLKKYTSSPSFHNVLNKYQAKVEAIKDEQIRVDKAAQESGAEVKTPESVLKIRNLSDYIADVRIFNRMWGMPGLMSFGVSGIKAVLKDKTSSKIMKLLELIDIVTIVAYQPLENIGFAAEHKWTTHVPEKAGAAILWYYVISCRLWAAFVAIEIIKLGVQYFKQLGTNEIRLFSNTEFTRSLVGNLANLPLTAHWSMYEGCLPDLAVGFFGTFSTCFDTINNCLEIVKAIKGIKYD